MVRQQTKSKTLGTMCKVPNFPTVSDVARNFFFPKTNLKVAVPHVGDTPGTNVFAKSRVARLTAAFCQLEKRGGKKA